MRWCAILLHDLGHFAFDAIDLGGVDPPTWRITPLLLVLLRGEVQRHTRMRNNGLESRLAFLPRCAASFHKLLLRRVLEGLALLLDLEELDLAQVGHRRLLAELARRVPVQVAALEGPFHFAVLRSRNSLALFFAYGPTLAPAGEVDLAGRDHLMH